MTTVSTLRVTHTFGRNAGAALTFAKDVVRFGRAPGNDVTFDPEHDRDASSHHAEARRDGVRWVLSDLKSRNGTFVGGRRVEQHVLSHGDEVTFGSKGPRVRIELEPIAAPAGSPEATPAKTADMEPLPEALAASSPVQPSAHVPLHAPAPAPDLRPSPAAPALASPAVAPAAPAPPDLHHGRPLAPAAGARVGQRTIAHMISHAVAAATGRARPRKTQEIHAMVDQQVAVATAGQRRSMIALGVLLLLAFGSLGGLILYGRRSEDEIAKLRSELAKLPPEDPRRKQIEGRLGTLHPSNANFGRNLYDRSRKGIFMLAAGGQGFCTAFAVRPNLLATNAHCIVAARKRGGSVVALENEGRGKVAFGVTEMRTHPAYRDADANAITPDVGVVVIAGQAAVVLELAAGGELAAIGAGDDVYFIGFPGRLMDASNPAATFLAANVGRVTGANGRPGAFVESWLVQHDAPTTHGTSGSPVFNGKGRVVAVNAGGYLEGEDETIAGKKTEVVKQSPYKFGMRIDLLDPLLR